MNKQQTIELLEMARHNDMFATCSIRRLWRSRNLDRDAKLALHVWISDARRARQIITSIESQPA